MHTCHLARPSKVSELEVLDLHSKRPTNYIGCNLTNFNKAPIPDGVYTLTKLNTLNLEYSCTGGTLKSEVGNLKNMVNLSLHGNYIGEPELSRCVRSKPRQLPCVPTRLEPPVPHASV
jgi:hypothetical protein